MSHKIPSKAPQIPAASSIWMKLGNNIALIGIYFSLGCTSSTESITPTRANLVESVYASGTVKSQNQYEVLAQIPGKIDHIFVKEGDSIKIGDPLFQLEGNQAQLSTDIARQTALANDLKQNQMKLQEALLAIDLAKKKLTDDSMGLARQQELAKQNIGTRVELEQKVLGVEVARANLKKATVLYEDLKRQLQLASAQSKTNLQLAQAKESDLVIRSEVTGVVYQLNAKKGELTTGALPLAVVGQSDFLIEFQVDEMDIVKIQKGQKVLLRLDSYPDQVFEARIRFIYPMMDERKRAFRVEALFTKKPETLFPNLSLEANIIIQERKSVLTIPIAYLQPDSSVILADGKTQKVEIGLRDDRIVEIRRGLEATTKIRLPKK